MAQYVYPIYESKGGSFYGTPTSVKGVEKRISDLVAFRRDRARLHQEKIEVQENRFQPGHPNDRLMQVCITVTKACGEAQDEKFVVYRSRIA